MASVPPFCPQNIFHLTALVVGRFHNNIAVVVAAPVASSMAAVVWLVPTVVAVADSEICCCY